MRSFELFDFSTNWYRACDIDSASPTVWEKTFLVALLLGATIVRLWGMSKLHYWDEMVYLQNAQVICCGKTNYSELAFRPPAISILFASLFLFSHSTYPPCIATALLNTAAPLFLYLAGRLCVGRAAAALGSLFLAFTPFFVGVFPPNFVSDDTGNSLLTDSPALTLITLSFWLLLRAAGRPTFLRCFVAGLALASTILMRFGALSCVAILLLLPVLSPRRLQSLFETLLGLTVGLTPYLFWSHFRYGSFFFTLKEGWTHVEGSVDPPSFFLRCASTIFTPAALAGFGLVVCLAVSSEFRQHVKAARNFSNSGVRRSRSLTVYLFVWLLIEFLVFSLIPHKEPRYIVPAAPPLFLLSGLGLAVPLHLPAGRRQLIGAGAVGVCLLWAFAPLRALLKKPFIDRQTPDEEAAGKLLTGTVPPGTLLYMSYNYPALAFYTNFHIHELSNVGPALYRDMASVPVGEVLVVYREAEAPSQSDTAWCDASHKFERIATYPSLVVYRRLPNSSSVATKPQ